MAGPTYTYTPDVPLGPTPMNETQPTILQNFQAINELIPVNHVGFNIPNNFGKHNTVTMEQQSVDPTTASTDLAVYVKATGDPNPAEIFYRYPNDGTVEQLTGSTGTAAATLTLTSSGVGYCSFSSGLKIFFGTQSITSISATYQTTSSTSSTVASAKVVYPITDQSVTLMNYQNQQFWAYNTMTGNAVIQPGNFPTFNISSLNTTNVGTYIGVGGINSGTNTINYMSFQNSSFST